MIDRLSDWLSVCMTKCLVDLLMDLIDLIDWCIDWFIAWIATVLALEPNWTNWWIKPTNQQINLLHWINWSGQTILFHQPRFPWNKWIFLTKPPFGVRSCNVAKIRPEIYAILWRQYISSVWLLYYDQPPYFFQLKISSDWLILVDCFVGWMWF